MKLSLSVPSTPHKNTFDRRTIKERKLDLLLQENARLRQVLTQISQFDSVDLGAGLFVRDMAKDALKSI